MIFKILLTILINLSFIRSDSLQVLKHSIPQEYNFNTLQEGETLSFLIKINQELIDYLQIKHVSQDQCANLNIGYLSEENIKNPSLYQQINTSEQNINSGLIEVYPAQKNQLNQYLIINLSQNKNYSQKLTKCQGNLVILSQENQIIMTQFQKFVFPLLDDEILQISIQNTRNMQLTLSAFTHPLKYQLFNKKMVKKDERSLKPSQNQKIVIHSPKSILQIYNIKKEVKNIQQFQYVKTHLFSLEWNKEIDVESHKEEFVLLFLEWFLALSIAPIVFLLWKGKQKVQNFRKSVELKTLKAKNSHKLFDDEAL